MLKVAQGLGMKEKEIKNDFTKKLKRIVHFTEDMPLIFVLL